MEGKVKAAVVAVTGEAAEGEAERETGETVVQDLALFTVFQAGPDLAHWSEARFFFIFFVWQQPMGASPNRPIAEMRLLMQVQ